MRSNVTSSETIVLHNQERSLSAPKSEYNLSKLLGEPTSIAFSVKIHQDARVYAAMLDPNHEVSHPLASDRHAWIQVAAGSVMVNDLDLKQGDAAGVSGESSVTIAAREPSEILLFDLA